MASSVGAKTPLTVVIHDLSTASYTLDTPSWVIQQLHHDFPDHNIVHAKSWADVDKLLPKIDVFFGAQFSAERLKEAKRLRYIHSHLSGVDFLLYPEMIASDVTIVNSPDIQTIAVAEHILMCILTLAKRSPLYTIAKAKNEWIQQKMVDEYNSVLELRRSTLVLVGIGHIGRCLLSMVKALGIYVIVVRLHAELGSDIADEVVEGSNIKTVLHRADFVVLAVPLTKSTYRIIDREALERLRPSAYLINISRGQTVDEQALIEALQNNKIAGAALDVFSQEPLSNESPLWSLPNVFITPHTAGSSNGRWHRTYQLWRDNLQRFIRGEPLNSVVEKSRGF